jgi:hypothetical protein
MFGLNAFGGGNMQRPQVQKRLAYAVALGYPVSY